MPAARSSASFWSEKPSSVLQTSSVCCPSSGAGLRIAPGVELSFGAWRFAPGGRLCAATLAPAARHRTQAARYHTNGYSNIQASIVQWSKRLLFVIGPQMKGKRPIPFTRESWRA